MELTVYANPTAEEGAIVKREWWNIWEHDEPPYCSYVIQSYDTAFSKSDRAITRNYDLGRVHHEETEEIILFYLTLCAVDGSFLN